MHRERQEFTQHVLKSGIQNVLSTMRLLGSEPRLAQDILHIGNTAINGNNSLVDEMRRNMGVDVTFFVRDEAVATTLRDAQGLRRIGFRLPIGAARTALFLQEDSYQSSQILNGETYYSSYAPILDRSRAVIGAVEVSLKESAAMTRDNQFRVALIILACGSLCSISLMFWLYGRNVTEKYGDTEQKLRTSKRHLDTALEKMANGICLFNRDNVLMRTSDHYVDVFGLRKGQLKPGMNLRSVIELLLDGESDKATRVDVAYKKILQHLETSWGPTTLEYPWKGRTLAVHHSFMTNGGWLLTYEDVTDQKEAHARIEHMAKHDAVTGLINRAVFKDKLETAMQASVKPALMVLDLDHFKSINDTLGHASGDALLKAFSDRISQALPKTALVARLDSDEFAILQTGITTQTQAAALAEKLSELAAEPFELDGRTLNIGATIGIVLPQKGDSSDVVMRNADLAVRSAKDQGRECFSIYKPEMGEHLLKRTVLEKDLRTALDKGQFEMFYQPLVRIKTGKIVGFEALMRWNHPVRGLVPPDEFIPVAEETGLIVQLGSWALRQSCLDAIAWPNLKIAVNISPIQFRTGKLIQHIDDVLAETKLPPSLLELEITETVIMKDKEKTLTSLKRLRDRGVQIAMDDFGTGYSSLSYLRAFKFDKVKIDRSFIAGLGERRDCDAIINAVLGIGRDLGMLVLAEGIETRLQHDRLRDLGCHEGQGYLFHKPAPIDQVPAIIERLSGITSVSSIASAVWSKT